MTLSQLMDAICSATPTFWGRTTLGLEHPRVLRHFLTAALEAGGTPLQAGQLPRVSESDPLLISAQVRDRAITQLAHTVFETAKSQLTQQQQSLIERVIKRANASQLIRVPVRQARYKAVRSNHLPNSANIAREEALASEWFEWLARQPACLESENCALQTLYTLVNLGYGLYPAASVILHLRRGELRLPTLCTPVHPDEPGPYFHHRITPPDLANALHQWADRLDKHPDTRARGGKLTQGQARGAALILPEHTSAYYSFKRLERLVKQLAKAHKTLFERLTTQPEDDAPSIPASFYQLRLFAARLRKRGLTHHSLAHALYTQLESLPLPTDTPNGLGDFLIDTRYQLTDLQRLPYHLAETGESSRADKQPVWEGLSANAGEGKVDTRLDEINTVTLAELQAHYSLDELYYAQAQGYLQHCLREWEQRFGKQYLAKGEVTNFIEQLKHQMLRVQLRFGDDAGLAVALHWLGSRILGESQQGVKFQTVVDFGRRVIAQALLDRELPLKLQDWEVHHPACFFERINTTARGERTRRQLHQQARKFLLFAREKGRLPADIDIPTVKERYIPFKRRNLFLTEPELINLCERLQLTHPKHGNLLALLHAVWFYTGIRPDELLSRSFRDIHLGDGEGYLIIQYGKSNQARRKIELEEDVPGSVHRLLKSYLEARLSTFPKQRRHFDNVALFGPDNNENAYDVQQMTRYLIQLVKEYTGKNIDLHAHRHRFITVQMVCASLPDDFDRSHLKPGVIPQTNPHRQGDISENYELVKKQAGHLYASTSFESYCHAFGLMLCAPTLCSS